MLLYTSIIDRNVLSSCNRARRLGYNSEREGRAALVLLLLREMFRGVSKLAMGKVFAPLYYHTSLMANVVKAHIT